ncbi:hypothetical protein [Enterobacter asburiae]|jgi:hypothetical protein|uniref:hypothetical protein n=1 Tax=Enterobacter asburiae TaxID=61645 RepID=UPI0028FF2FFE|nr:hypothetical protein [Enterobacter asburiae]MDU0855796.1 hypothetical protein [Enterobacter asburiae]MDU1105923.1 hypothetical protein [Enterobacter sp.]
MPLIPDNDQELNLSPAVILPNENFMPMLSGGEGPVNPAGAYLLSLNSARSWQTMYSFRDIVAGMLGAASLESYSWGTLRCHHVMAVTELLRETGVPLPTSAATKGIPQCL